MYKGGFCVNVVKNGNILEDDNGTVALSFGSEYKIRLKNKNTRDSVAKVFIDGEDATSAGDIIIHSGSTMELERFIENLGKGNRFKFIDLDTCSDSEKDNTNNGIIEVKFRLKSEPVERIIYHHPVEEHHYYYPKKVDHYPFWYGGTTNTGGYLGNITTCNTGSLNSAVFTNGTANANYCCTVNNLSKSISDVSDGKTVRGSSSNQKFEYSYIGELEDKETVIKLKLVGYKKELNVGVLMPLLNSKYCTNCGSTVRTVDKFC